MPVLLVLGGRPPAVAMKNLLRVLRQEEMLLKLGAPPMTVAQAAHSQTELVKPVAMVPMMDRRAV